MTSKNKSKKASAKEEELLLQDFSRHVSKKSNVLFYGNALIVSAIPIWLFVRIHHMDLKQSAIIFAIMTIVSTILMAMAYKNMKFLLKHSISRLRDSAVAKEVMKLISENKSMSREEKDERILWKKNEVADYEATTFSIFYNNAMFIVMLIVISCFLLSSFAPAVNYALSVGITAGLIALFSTSSQ